MAKRATTMVGTIACVAACLQPLASLKAAEEAHQHALKIERQPLARALQKFARQSGIQIIFFSDVVDGYEAQSLRGHFTTEAALRQLLDKSPLTFREIGSNTIEILLRTSVESTNEVPPPGGLIPEIVMKERAPMSRKMTDMRSNLLGIIFSATAASASAQSDTPPVTIEEDVTLEEIIVTAQKRPESQQKVPVTMEVISGDKLREAGRNDMDEMLENISGVLIQSNTDGLRVSIRGVSNDNSPFGNVSTYTPSVAVNQDGIYTNRNQGNQNMFDVERVEVLFGPQATIYATASPGGIVNVISADPQLMKFEGTGTLEYGDYDTLHTEGSVNVPLSEKAALRAAFSQSIHSGYLTNGSMDEDIKSARVKTLFTPNEDLSILLAGEISRSGGQGFASVTPFDKRDGHWYTSAGMFQPLVKDGKVTDPWTSSASSAGQGQDRKTRKMNARVEWSVGNLGMVSVTGSYLKNDSYSASITDSGGLSYNSISSGNGFEKGLEIRMTSDPDASIKWIVGGNIYRSRDSQTSSSQNVNLSSDYRSEYFSSLDNMETIYANITVPFTTRMRTTFGVRKNNHEDGLSMRIVSPSFVENRGDTITYNKPNYKIGAELDVASDSMIFADWSTSYRMNGALVAGSPTEELHAYTIGTKNRFRNNRLQVNAAIFYYDYKNYFANGPRFDLPYDSDGNGTLDATYEVDGKRFGDAIIYGGDLQTSTIITDRDRLDLSVSYAKKYFSDLAFNWPDALNSLGIPDLDYSGRDMPQAPNWNAAASYSHTFALRNGASLRTGIEARYVSKTLLNWQAETLSLSFDQNDDGTYTGGYTATVADTGDVRWQEAYHIENIHVTYSDSSDRWTLRCYANNLGDYAVKRFLDGMNNMMIGNPMTYGAVLNVKF